MKPDYYELHENKQDGSMYIFELSGDDYSVLWSQKYTKDELYMCASVWALLYGGVESAADCGDNNNLNYDEVIMGADWIGYSHWQGTYGLDELTLGESGKEVWGYLMDDEV